MVARDLKNREEEVKTTLNKNLHVSCFYKFSEGGLGSIGYFTSADLLLAALNADSFFGITEHYVSRQKDGYAKKRCDFFKKWWPTGKPKYKALQKEPSV